MNTFFIESWHGGHFWKDAQNERLFQRRLRKQFEFFKTFIHVCNSFKVFKMLSENV